jgi:hypothetical protein
MSSVRAAAGAPAKLALVVALVVTIVAASQACGRVQADADPERGRTGEATYYAPGIMEQVWARRVRWGDVGDCADCIGAVALLDQADLGKRVWVTAPPSEAFPDGDTVGPLLVVDCARAADRERLRRRGWVVDLPWWIALRWKALAGPVEPVTVTFAEPDGTAGAAGWEGLDPCCGPGPVRIRN